MLGFLAASFIIACMGREGRFVDKGSLSMVVPEPQNCKVLENRFSGGLMNASLHSRDGEQARFLRCYSERGSLEVTAVVIDEPVPTPLAERLREDASAIGEYTSPPEHTEVSLAGRPALREYAEIIYAGLPQKRIVVLARDGDVLRGAAVMGTPSVFDKYEARIDAWLASVEFSR